MKRKVDLFEVLVIFGCLLFTVAISLYHLSFDGYLGLSAKFWKIEWSVAENGSSLFFVFVISMLTNGIIKKAFRFILIPYFVLKLVYQFSCYSGIYFWSARIWENIWSWVLVIQLLFGIMYIMIVRR